MQIVQCGSVSQLWNSTEICWKTFKVPWLRDRISHGHTNYFTGNKWLTFMVATQSAKTMKLLYLEGFAIYGISRKFIVVTIGHNNTVCMHVSNKTCMVRISTTVSTLCYHYDYYIHLGINGMLTMSGHNNKLKIQMSCLVYAIPAST